MSRRRHSRRDFLKTSGAVLATPLLLNACGGGSTGSQETPPTRPATDPAVDGATSVAFDASSVTEDLVQFAMGVQAGAAETTALTFWSHVEDVLPRTLRVWRDSDTAGTVVLAHESTVTPNDGGFLKSRVTGLAPDTVYRYAFFTGAAPSFTSRSTVGRVRTAYPADYLWPVTVGATTCTNRRHAPWTALQNQAAENLDVMLHLGDMSYNDGARTLDEYRAKWRSALTDPGYLALLPTVGTYLAWDDHEFTNDLNPETIDPVQMQNALASFWETLPAEPNPANGKLWRSFRWGRSVEFFILDCRTERKPSTLNTPAPRYMSREQMTWLKQALQESTAHFKVMLNSVPIVDFPDSFWANRPDRWEGYAAAREELLSFIEQNAISNVWFLSGDFHIGFVAHVEASGWRHRMYDIAVGPGGNSGNPLPALAMSSEDIRLEAFPEEMFETFHARISSTTLVFDPLRDEVRVSMKDAATAEVFYEAALTQKNA